MQEQIEQQTLTLVVNGAKVAGKFGSAPFRAAIRRYLKCREQVKTQKWQDKHQDRRLKQQQAAIPRGKQTVKQLIGQNQGASSIEITDPSIKEFEKIARKYGVNYAVKKDRSSSPPKYLIFFKARDSDALTAAFQEYTGKVVKKATKKAQKDDRTSLLEKLQKFKEKAKQLIHNVPGRKEPVR